ncbi:MAG: metallopeptidase TldD-related protein [Bdellovibrionota bacterium]|nr:metallopeptidase TldD-related protein [Bdellovibrionota bacterium]
MITKNEFHQIAGNIYKELNEGEDLSIGLDGEETTFMRFSKSRIRQLGDIDQTSASLRLTFNERSLTSSFSLSGDVSQMEKTLKEELLGLRKEISSIEKDPHFTPIVGGQSSEEYLSGKLLDGEIASKTILEPLRDVDGAGIYCSGKVIRATSNSKDQSHWFENDSFYVDFSLYSDKQKAVKGGYAGREFIEKEYLEEIQNKKDLLQKVSHPSKKMEPGKYRVYLAPAAVAEILGTLSWQGFSHSALKKGMSPLKRFNEGETLSEKVTINEDFSLGFSPRFNDDGEVSPEKLSLFKDGKLENTLISTRTAKEYGVESNFSSSYEMPRSISLEAGTLHEAEALKTLEPGLFISNLHYLNFSDLQNGRITGMTRFACFYVENGQIVAPIEDLRFDESFYHFFGKGLVDLTDNVNVFPVTDSYEQRSVGAMSTPGMIVNDFRFTL